MENRANILHETGQISQAVANIGNQNVYTVPAGYFDNLPQQVLAKLADGGLQATPMPYSVPDGYFDNLAGSIMAKIKLQQQLPETGGFFKEIKEHNILPAGLPTPYSIPVGYFNSLAGNVMAAIKIQQQTNNEVFEELQEIAPLLNTIKRQMPYSVPQGYFEQLTVEVVTQHEKPVAKVVAMGGRVKFMRYAVAACIAVLVGIGGYWFNTKGHTIDGNENDFDKTLASLSVDDINAYLNSQAATSTDAEPETMDEQAPDMQLDLKETSTQEIQQYLKENSDPDEKGGKDI